MLVYTNHLTFPATRAVNEVIATFAHWLSRRVRLAIDLERMIQGIRTLRFRDSSVLSTTSTFILGEIDRFPFLFNATYSHNDAEVNGRRWTFEFGVRQVHSSATVECTILLRTDERSVLVRNQIEVSRPSLIDSLMDLAPVPGTPGLQIQTLGPESAKDFVDSIESEERRTPIILLSPDRDGHYLSPLDQLHSQVIGLCDIYVVDPEVDTYKLVVSLGRDRLCFGGAARIFWPKKAGTPSHFCPATLLLPTARDSMSSSRYSGTENPILAALTDRSNVLLSARHISKERVHEQVLRTRLERASASSSSFEVLEAAADLQVYQDLLTSVDTEIRQKDQEVATLRDELLNLQIENAKLQGLAAGYGRGGSNAGEQGLSGIEPLRAATLALYNRNITLSQALVLIQSLFSDRVVVLPSAFDSANESDSARFLYAGRAAELLIALATAYWEALAAGGSDQQAKECFSVQAYSSSETGLSPRGVVERTFVYQGQKIRMDNHLKIGVKDSLATTLRIHFHWVASEQKIVIGHCGRHLEL